MIYTVARYESLDDNQFLVGFNLSDDNENSAYVESILDLSEINGKTQEEVCQLAYDAAQEQINKFKERFNQNSESVIGRVFVPTEN